MPDFILDLMRKRLVKKLSWSFGCRGRLIPVLTPRATDIDVEDDVSCILLFRSLRMATAEIHDRADQIQSELDKWANYTVRNFVTDLDPHASPNVTHISPHWYTGPVVPRLQPRAQFPELEFPCAVWQGRKVALYSLTDLLGEEMVQNLAVGSKYESQRCLIVRRTRHNVPTEILLMQLQAYVARCGP